MASLNEGKNAEELNKADIQEDAYTAEENTGFAKHATQKALEGFISLFKALIFIIIAIVALVTLAFAKLKSKDKQESDVGTGASASEPAVTPLKHFSTAAIEIRHFISSILTSAEIFFQGGREIWNAWSRNTRLAAVAVTCCVMLLVAAVSSFTTKEVPNRLSCADNTPPRIWEDGAVHFDFTKGLMLRNDTQKIYIGSSRKESRSRTILFDKAVIRGHGRAYPINEWISVERVGKKNGGILIEVTGSSTPKTHLACLGMDE